jgi:Protein of unknown function (DUF3455)
VFLGMVLPQVLMSGLRNLALIYLLFGGVAAVAEEIPRPIDDQGINIVLRVHAEGAQIYECKADADGKLVWQFREPIAALFEDGKTVGRHYAGPAWEIGGSIVKGKVSARSPGKGKGDIPLLALDVVENKGDGPLQSANVIRRINTRGGNVEGPCESAGALHSEAYAAEYVFGKR